MRRAILALALTTSSMWAQSVISAHSGVIHLTEGTVELDGQVTQSPAKLGEFVDVKNGQTLATKDGDAEVLLTPGVFLRIAENSSFKMISNKLDDTRIEVLSGSAMIQVGELLAGNAITVVYHNSDITLAKRGLYRIDSDPAARLRVYDGEAQASSGEIVPVTVRKSHELVFDGQKLEAKNFDMKETDAFYRWNARRDEYISEANVYAAKSARDSGQGMGFYTADPYNAGGYAGLGTWAFNPFFGMFTYMPYNGMSYSPFGYGYFSPFMVGYLYMPGSPFYGMYNNLGGLGSAAGLLSRNGTSLGSSTGITKAGAVGALGAARGANGAATASATRGGFFGGGSNGGSGSTGGGVSSSAGGGRVGGGSVGGGHGGGGGAHR